MLVFGGDPYQINVLDLASHQQTPLLKHPTYNLLYGRFSPDNRWVSFTVRTEPNRGHIAIAPVDGPKPVPESAWITITESEAQDWANWSPDGKTLYFTSRRDGHYCLWGQRLEAHLPPAGGRRLRRAASSRARVLSTWRVVGGGRPNRIGPRRGYRQYLDDVTLQRPLSLGEACLVLRWLRRRGRTCPAQHLQNRRDALQAAKELTEPRV